MRYEPLYERVICRRIDPETTAAGGLLHIPEQAQEKPQEGEVLYVGCGRLLEDGRVIPLLVKPGDRVLFGKYAGTEIEINGEKVVILREDELLARQTSED